MARQRSRVDWLREGDHNTEFFHARASTRRCTNKIKMLIKDDGTRCSDQGGMKDMVQHFYGNLFTSEPGIASDEVLDAIPQKVDPSMNDSLCSPFIDDEIKTALFQMGPTKAPVQMDSQISSTKHTGNFLNMTYVLLYEAF